MTQCALLEPNAVSPLSDTNDNFLNFVATLINQIRLLSYLLFICFRTRLFIDALWSPTGKGLTSWLSLVVSNCEVINFPLVS